MFDYYTIADSEQIRFYQLPRELVKHERFKGLSDSAKILYALLRDRVSLSVKNNWVDEMGRVYIIFTLAEIMEDLGCANQKATKSMKELQKIGLVENVRRGLGKPNILYVKNFASGLGDTSKSLTNPINPLIHENHESGTMKIMNQESLKSGIKSHENHEQSILTLSHTNLSDIESKSKSSQSHTDAPQKLSTKGETDKAVAADDNTTINNLVKKSKNKKTSTITDEPINQHKQMEVSKYNKNHYNSYKTIIQENIDYENFIHSRSDIPLIDGLIETMLDVICTENPTTIKMGNETKNRDLVRSIYLKLKYEHIAHVVNQYKAQHHQIIHKGAYMRKMLYTVYQELDAHYTNQVRADGVVW